MTTLVPAALLAVGAAAANLGFTPVAATLAAIVAAMGYTPANKAGETFTGPTQHTAAHPAQCGHVQCHGDGLQLCAV